MTFKKGHKQTEETKRKIGLANAINLKGYKQSPEHIEKRVSQLRGRKRSPFSKQWRKNMSKSHIGKIHSGSFKKGHKHPKETLKKISESLRGKKSWNYIDGRSKLLSPARYGKNWKKIRTRILIRDDYKCKNCGSHKSEVKFMDIHHINPFLISYNNSENNLITLCRRCHMEIEKNLIKKNKVGVK